MADTKQSRTKKQDAFPVVHRRAAGLDVGSTFHVVAIPEDSDPEPVRRFESFTGDLHRLADWLAHAGITTIAMESTGVYWIPVFELLESKGFEVLLVNARDVKTVPGRKTDFNDAQWIQRLHTHGLLRASFRPTQQVATLRAFLRHRDRLVEYSASTVQHIQKALMQMNVQLHHVVSDVTGVTGMQILRAVVAGERDPGALARFRDVRCKASLETIRAALTGNYRDEHVFALKQGLELHDVYQQKIHDCDAKIEEALLSIDRVAPRGAEQESDQRPARSKRPQKNEPRFDIRTALATLLGVDLTQIHGIGPHAALKLVSECGADMSRWPTAKHFTSWLTLAPGSKISGGKVLSSKTRRSANRATHLLRLAAVSVGRTSTALGAFYRRLATRIGKAKAVIATARKIAILFYNTLRHGAAYVDPGADYYEERYRKRVLDNLRRRAHALGYELTSPPTDAVGVS
jgi:transposase